MNTFDEAEKKFFLSEATIEDINEIIKIENSVSGERTYSPMLTKREWIESFKVSKVFLINSGNNIIGEVSYVLKSPTHAYIDGLVIMPEFQGNGFARRAMIKIMNDLKSYEVVDLVTHPENKRAILLYESLGFKIKERVENYFGDGEPRVQMIYINNNLV